jgi:D-3-phosphoglycerate dehydrogenase
MKFVAGSIPSDPEMEKKVEDGKKNFAGFELAGHTLGVIGLGKIGCLVADVAIKLGMNVLGYDPEITVDAAWSLPSQVKKANSVGEVLKSCQLHLDARATGRCHAQDDQCRHAGTMKHGAVLLNFSREGVVDEAAVLAALDAKKLGCLRLRLPQSACQTHPHVIALPHLGASTAKRKKIARSWSPTSCATTWLTATCRTR